ncbi:flavin reductase family protein [Nocardioides daeguensis]|uniref:Flavin reductase like domain-containing protein n=1 Tax=Nocardioides daeguensis TaxID=908359 RepID=A0ABP6W8N9_9ACTN|nr:flavin reductase family protein [Nocardioides daeguensis]MBV6729808.1 flavin reductase family protein [Nocardioides daeguensis]MCR1775379.1 flavin reductase family protein [Nocardioides daeguensis]
MSVSREEFRSIVGAFPTGVTVVTVMDADGRAKGLTSNAFTSVSADPPLLLVCVDKSSRSLPALRQAGSFVVHFLAESASELSAVFASRSHDKFAGLAWTPSEVANGAPVLEEGVVAHAECRTYAEVDAGDHVILLGRIECGERRGGSPLMYYQRQYGAWPSPVDA